MKQEEDAELMLQAMTSNGLVVNPTNTTFMILNHKTEDNCEVKVSECTIQNKEKAKLIRMIIDNDQNSIMKTYL